MVYDSSMKKRYDIVIIGAGIVGVAIAYELSKYECSVLLLEKESSVGSVQTSANSAIIHSGHDPIPGTLKAKLCKRGNELFQKLSRDLDFPLWRLSGLMVSTSKKEEAILTDVLNRAKQNKVSCAVADDFFLDYLGNNLSKKARTCLYIPSTFVCFPWKVVESFLLKALQYNLTLRLNTEVIGIQHSDDVFSVKTSKGENVESRILINASGVNSEKITKILLTDCAYESVFRKGEYFVLDREVCNLVNNVIYPVPTSKGKGVIIIPQIDGQVLIGPNSSIVSDPNDVSTSKEGLEEVREKAKLLVEDIPFSRTIRCYAGIRSSLTQYDFFIDNSEKYPNFFMLGGIDSPGLTSAPAIAEYLVEKIRRIFPLRANARFDPILRKKTPFSQLSFGEKEARIANDPLEGQIVCRCENITAREIIEAYESPVGGRTIKALKQRTRAGAGLCQGGYCEEKILKLLADYYKRPMSDFTYSNESNNILLSKEEENDAK